MSYVIFYIYFLQNYIMYFHKSKKLFEFYRKNIKNIHF